MRLRSWRTDRAGHRQPTRSGAQLLPRVVTPSDVSDVDDEPNPRGDQTAGSGHHVDDVRCGSTDRVIGLLVLIVVLQFVTAPISAHLVVRAAYRRDRAPDNQNGATGLADSVCTNRQLPISQSPSMTARLQAPKKSMRARRMARPAAASGPAIPPGRILRTSPVTRPESMPPSGNQIRAR